MEQNPVSPSAEPLRFTAALVAVVNAALILLVAFGVELTPEQTAAIIGFANAALSFGAVAVWARRKVAPIDSISLRIEEDDIGQQFPVATFADGSELWDSGDSE